MHPASAGDAANEARAINQQVNALIKASNFAEAEALAKKGLPLCDNADDVKVFCTSQFNEALGDIAYAQKQYPAALEYQEQALHLREAGLTSGHPLICRSLLRVGRAYLALQRKAEAATFFERAVSGFEKQANADRELGVALSYLRRTYVDDGRLELAVAAGRRELAVFEATGDKDGKAVTNAKLNLSDTLSRQARVLIDQKNYSSAEKLLSEAAQLIDPLPPGREGQFVILQTLLGDVYQGEGRFAEAEPFMLRALEYRSKIAGPADTDMPTVLFNLASFYNNWDRPSDTVSYAARSIAWLDENKSENRTLGLDLLYLGRAQRKLGHLPKAETALLRAKEVLDRVLTASDSQRVNVRTDIGSLWIDQERFDEAEPMLQSALEIEGGFPRPQTVWRSSVLASLALLYREQARYKEAEQLTLEAVKLEEAAGKERAAFLGQRLTELASIYRRENRYAEAEAALLRALALPQPELDRAAAQNALGVVYESTAQYEKAETVLKQALAIRTRILSANNFSIGETIGNIATVDSSRARYSDAEAGFRHVLEIVDSSGPSNSSNAALYSMLLSQALVSQGKLDEAASLIGRALDIFGKRLGIEHPRYGSALKTLASIEVLRGQDRKADDHYRQALAIDEKVVGPQSPAVAGDLLNLVPILKRAGNRQEARADIDRALAINTTAFGADSPLTASTMQASAQMAYEAGKYSDARQLADRVQQIQEQNFGPDHFLLAAGRIFMSQLDIAQGRLDDADHDVARAAEIVAKALPADSPSNIEVLQAKVIAARARGKFADAEQYASDALGLAEKLYQPDRLGTEHPRYGDALKTLASIEVLRGQDRKAEYHYRQALAIDEKVVGPQSPAVAGDLLDLVPILKRAGNRQDARADIDRAIAIDTAAFGPDSPPTAAALQASATMNYEAGKYADARQLADRVRQIQERNFGPDHFSLATGRIFLSQLDIAQGRLDDADHDVARAAEIVAKALSADSPSNIEVLQGKAVAARARGKLPDAEQYYSDALGIARKLYQPDHPVRRNAIDQLTGALWVQGKFADAERLQRDELGLVEFQNGADNPAAATALRGVAGILGNSGRQSEAVALFRRALAIDEKSFGPQSDQAAWDHLVLGSLLRRTGKFDDALGETNLARHAWESQGHVLAARSALEELAMIAFDRLSPAEGIVFVEQAVDVTERAFGSDSPGLAGVLAQLGRYYAIVGRKDAAEKILARINGLIGDDPPEQAPGYLAVLQLRAQLSAERGNIDEAEAALIRVLAFAAKYGGPQGEAIGNNSFNLAFVYLKANRFQDAIKYFAKALDIFKRENGDHAPIVGYTLLAAAQAYDKIGDAATSKALLAAAIEILGPTIAALRPQPKWL